MEYRSQLVVRTRDKEGARIIERVKEIADERGTSISDAALLLLGQAIDGKVPAPDASDETPSVRREPKKVEAKKEEAAEEAPRMPSSPNLNDAPHNVVVKAVEYLESKGNAAAARCLAEFYESASAVDGGRVRAELTHRLKPAEYDELHAVLRETDEYRQYTRRLVGQ